MENVLGLEDKSNDFSNFLTVSQKFVYICLYILHTIYLSKSIWQMILSHTKNFNIFPSSIQLDNILKILTIVTAKRYTISWLEISGLTDLKNLCLTIDCRKSGLVNYRTNADSNFEQFCYYGQNKKDRLFNKFLAKRA